ncbi:MAG: hypothetical protein Q7S40_12060 [Opitutaceae bacterium]|nr:hypothetical protein [Opitutaceae bacterium]
MSSSMPVQITPVPASTGRTESRNSYYPAPIEQRENRWLHVRRASAAERKRMVLPPAPAAVAADIGNEPPLCEVPDAPDTRPPNIAGLALSGGGIRSGTFCLGLLQSLAANGLLRKIDYLSTVSGGGYIGSFLGAWIARRRFSDGPDPVTNHPSRTEKFDGIEEVESRLDDLDTPQLQFLRENGRFLAPNGAGDAWGAAAVHVRNWLSMLVVIGALIVGVFMVGESVKLALNALPAGWRIRALEPGTIGGLTISWSIFWPAVAWAVVLGAVPLALGYWLAFPLRRGPAPTFYLFNGLWTYVVAALLFKLPLPAFVQAHPWGWLVVLTITLEWCLWADFRQRLRQRPEDIADPNSARKWTGYVGVVLVGLVAVAFLYIIAAARLNLPLPRFIEQWPRRSLAFALLIGFWHGSRELSLLLSRANHHSRVRHYVARAVAKLRDVAEVHEADFSAARSALTSGLVTALTIALGVTVYAVVDTAAQTIASEKEDMLTWIWTLCSPAALVGLMHSVLPRLLADDEVERRTSSLWMTIGLWAAAIAMLAIGVIGLATAARLWAVQLWGDGEATAAVLLGQPSFSAWAKVTLAALALFIVSVLLGRRLEFVNLCSHHELYSARLTRAYLGASNPQRQGNWQVTETVTGDQIEFRDYKPQARGGPLHLINATVNETVSGRSNIEQRDRKGFSFAIGPAGLSVRRSDHALFNAVEPFARSREAQITAIDDADSNDPGPKRFHVFGIKPVRKYFFFGDPEPDRVTVEMPPVGAWVGLSGAAFTTGLGARTSLATSLLLGLFNVRLGYWWDSGVEPAKRNGIARRTRVQRMAVHVARIFPAQIAFLDEMLARFHGPARRYWYLSDGGHFENTAAYELIRRRVPLILCCDCGCDPDYTYEDVGNLVRKARMDFGARIRFLNQAQLRVLSPEARRVIGPLSALRSVPNATAGQKLSRAHAALATVTYPDENGGYSSASATSLLLLIKPTLTANLSRDVLQYAVDNAPFPQQSTLDQFFDEAQWESYRQLGWEIGQALFTLKDLVPTPGEPGWLPGGPPPPAQPPAAGATASESVLEGLLRTVLRHCEQHSDLEEVEPVETK